MRTIQEIFAGEFENATLVVVQKLRPEEHNLSALRLGYTEKWNRLPADKRAEVLALAIDKSDGSKCREIWAGFINDMQPTTAAKFRFYVDRFRFIGEHDREVVSDADFYDNGGGGGSRNYAFNQSKDRKIPVVKFSDLNPSIPEGENERRLVWVRKHHEKFRDPVWRHWDGKCAVTDQDCNGLLVASHIHPWAKSSGKEKTDPNNGLLLSVPLDKLFDRGWISFSKSGRLLIKSMLSEETRTIFGLRQENMSLRMQKVNREMLSYIERHRIFHGFS